MFLLHTCSFIVIAQKIFSVFLHILDCTSIHVLNKNLVTPDALIYSLESPAYPEKLRDGWLIYLIDTCH